MNVTERLRRVGFAALAIAAAVCSPVHGQDSSDLSDFRSESTALKLSAWGTLLPIGLGTILAATGPTDTGAAGALVLLVGGAVVGPSLGHFYARRPSYALAMSGVRAAVALGFGALALSSCPEFEGCTTSEETRFAVFLLTGSAILGGLAVFDILRAPRSARLHRRQLTIQVHPVIVPKRSIGLAAKLRF